MIGSISRGSKQLQPTGAPMADFSLLGQRLLEQAGQVSSGPREINPIDIEDPFVECVIIPRQRRIDQARQAALALAPFVPGFRRRGRHR